MPKSFRFSIFLVILQLAFYGRVQGLCERNQQFIDNYFQKDGTIILNGIIGEGEYNEVYRLKWRGLANDQAETIVAMKIPKATEDLENSPTEGLIKEERILKKAVPKIGTNHLPVLHGCYIDDNNQYYLVTQYLTISLAPDFLNINELEESKKNKEYIEFVNLPPLDRFEVYAQIAEGLHQLHENKITHGDLKPENLLFEKTANNWNAYLVDFGGSAEIQVRPKIFTPTYIDEDFYNHYFASNDADLPPEEMKFYEFGPKLDVYALAITIFVFENSYDHGRKRVVSPSDYIIYEGRNMLYVIRKIKDLLSEGSWIDERKLNFANDENFSFKELIRTMMAEKPKDRPTAERVAHDLRSMKFLANMII